MMKYRTLGRTDLTVSLIGLGTMTWGEQNTEAEAHAQLDYALGRGITLIDTAEMYPVPPTVETQGRTESYIGSWLARTGRRHEVVLATKAAGPASGNRPRHLRNGESRHDRKNLTQALHSSLDRLQTDHVDLYQLHWPDRSTNTFGALSYAWLAEKEASIPIEETLSVLADFVREGKVRYIGVSNETPWGLAQFTKAAENLGLPRIVSIQNSYSLLNRTFEVGLSEFSQHEQVSLLAYSPLAAGTLTGKYLNGQRPANSRLTLFDRFVRYSRPLAEESIKQYIALANEVGVTPAQLALAFVNSRPFVGSTLIGATSQQQLIENIDSINIDLSSEVLDEIEKIHLRLPNPTP